jgi:hypothetical protein
MFIFFETVNHGTSDHKACSSEVDTLLLLGKPRSEPFVEDILICIEVSYILAKQLSEDLQGF